MPYEDSSQAGELKGIKAVQTPEEQRANSKEAITELAALAAPLVEWLRKYHDPCTEIRISWDYVSVKHDGVGLPFAYSEK